MAQNESITITLLKWDESKYKPRKDVDHPTWFKCSNRLLEDSDFYNFTHEEILVWYRIMELVSQKQSATICLSYEHSARACRLSREAIDSAINKLKALKLLSANVTKTLRRRNVDVTSTAHRIEENRRDKNRIEKKREEPPADFDFESVYESYPRKEGKDAGLRNIADQVRNQETFDEFKLAAHHYAQVMERRNAEQKFIKQWSSFVGTKRTGFPWREYILRPAELDQPSASGAETSEQRTARMLREHEELKRREDAIYGPQKTRPA